MHLQSLKLLSPTGLEEMNLQEIHLIFDLDVGVKVIQNVAQYLHHVTNAPGKFAVATSSNLGGDASTRNTLFDF